MPARSASRAARRGADVLSGGRRSVKLTASASCGARWILDRVALRVEQVALAIALEDGAEQPSVAVEVGELRLLQAAR